jgi:putative two-component system response regulator
MEPEDTSEKRRASTVLVVDDEPAGRKALGAILSAQGYFVALAADGPEALAEAVLLQPDLILLDVMMPGMDGFEVCRRLRATPDLADVPVLMLTALDDPDSRLNGIEAGADDFISKPFDRAELRARVRTITRLNRYRRLRDQLHSLLRAQVSLEEAYEETLEGWVHALDLRNKEIEGHTRRVTELTLRLAGAAGMTRDELVHVRRGALLHDVGKLAVPDSILNKPGPLTDEERAMMQQHPVHAYEWLSKIEYLWPARDIPYCHHERWNGEGYPRGLRERDIPLAARCFTVVDVWDALRSERIYKESWPAQRALAYIRSLAGVEFDPVTVDLFVEISGQA